MKNMIQKIVLMTVMFLLSVLAYAQPENNSVFRLQSKNSAGEDVFAVVVGDKIEALTAEEDGYVLKNSLWLVSVSGENFTLQNMATGKFLNVSSRKGLDNSAHGKIYSLSTDNTGLSFIQDDNGYGYLLSAENTYLYIQYDPKYNEWRYYSKESMGSHDPKLESQGTDGTAWNDSSYPPSSEETSLEIPGSVVDEMLGSNGEVNVENLWEFISDTTRNQILEFLDAPSIPIVVGVKATYPLGDFWKASTIKLEVNSEDWTPISFPIDVRCITSDLSGVGYQEYDTKARAEKRYNDTWVTGYITNEQVFEKGKAYHFATDSRTVTLEFESVATSKLIKITDKYQKVLESIGDDELNANWYYIGNALFVEASMVGFNKISRYNKSIGKWEEEDISGDFGPFATFFVQYAGDYSVVASAASTQSSAPRLVREKSATEKYYLRIEGEGDDDQTGIFFEEEASAEGYVIGEDFLSFATKGRSFTEIYTYEEDIEFAFNTRPMENTFVKVGLYVGKAGRYTISLDNVSGNAESMILYDTYEQDFARLHLGETYTFDSEKGSFDDRFAVAVTYAPSTTTDNISLSAMNMVVVNNEIQGLEVGVDYAIYDSTGRMVYSSKADAETVVLPDLNTGVYIVRTATGWVKFVVK